MDEIGVSNILDTVQTFVDDSRIVASHGVVRRFHSAVRHRTEPVLAQTLDCEANIIFPSSVLQDPEDGGYRMWYACHSIKGVPTLHYATSPDGLTWEKPALQSDSGNRLCWADGTLISDWMCSIMYEADEADASRRYKMIYYRTGYYLAYSGDGKTWTPYSDEPVWVNGSGDGLEECYFFLRDERLGKYRGYMRVWTNQHTVRRVALGESDDLTQWSGPSIIWSAGPEFDPGAQFYGMNVFIDGGVYWGLPWLLCTSESLDPRYQQTIRLKLGFSHDGVDWQSVCPEEDALPLGEPGTFDSEMLYTFCPVVQCGDECRLYYSGRPTKHDYDGPKAIGGIGIATFRRNGFVSLRAEDEGLVQTERFLFKGDELRINAITAETGSIEAELIAPIGDLIKGFTFADADPFVGDATDQPLSWGGRSDLSPFTGQDLTLRLRLRKADLFTFRAAGHPDLFTASAEPPPVRSGHCLVPPVIDGNLKDQCWMDWGNSGIAEDFVQFEKIAPAKVHTRAMFTRDDEYLYIGVDCNEPFLDKLVAEREENELEAKFEFDDSIEIRLNAPGQGTFFNQLCVNTAGKRFQAWFSTEEGGSRIIHDVVWQAAVSQLPGHWYAELSVPFTALNASPPVSGERWQLNIMRHRHTEGYEISCWSCMFGRVHRNDLSGTLVFS